MDAPVDPNHGREAGEKAQLFVLGCTIDGGSMH
jgi:hypothetical protein